MNDKIVDKEKASLYSAVFINPDGRKVVDDLVSFVGYFGEGFSPDPYSTSYNCGQRRVVTRILSLLGIGHAVDMINELKERQMIDE